MKQPIPYERVHAADYPGTTLLQLAELLRRKGWLLGSDGLHLVKIRVH